MSNSVPEGWYQSKLGVVADLIMGQSPPSNTYNNSRIGLPFFQGKTDFGSHYPSVRVWCSKPTKVAEKDSILFSVRAPVGDINIASESCCIGRGLAAIKGTKVEQAFLYQTFKFVKHRFQLLAQGSTFEAVSGGEMRDFKLILPPLPEQKKIAAILTSVDTVIEKTQAQIDKLKDLKTGIMQELLTKGIGHTEFKDSPVGRIPVEWEVKDLGDLAFKIEGGGTPPRKNPDYWGKGYPWATVKDLKSIRLSSTEESITKTGLINSSSKLVPAGTVILATRMAVGKAVVFDCDVTINQDLKAFYPKEKLNNKFLLQWYLYKSKYIASLGTGSTVKGIRVDDLKLLIIAVPPYDEQIIIANKIEGIEVLLNHKIAKIQKMTSLKKALMQDLLTGKVRVKV